MNTNILVTANGLSDRDLLARLDALAGRERAASAELVAHLAALDSRPSLYAAEGYGSLFDPANTSTTQTNALTFLQTVQYYGNAAKTTDGADFPDWQRIYGANDVRINRLQSAFTKIMQAGIQVSLIE